MTEVSKEAVEALCLCVDDRLLTIRAGMMTPFFARNNVSPIEICLVDWNFT